MYQGYFLNLDRNAARKDKLITHLRQVGALERYERFPAVDGSAVADKYLTKLSPGELGLWLTHENVLRKNIDSNIHIHVIEDDVLLAKNAVAVFDRLLNASELLAKSWDVIYTEALIPIETGFFRFLRDKLNNYAAGKIPFVMEVQNLEFAGSTSMIINSGSVAKILQLISGGWRRGAPIDIALRGLIRRRQLNGESVLPFFTSIVADADNSDIRGNTDLSRRLFNCYRRAVFVEADYPALLKEIQRLSATSKLSPLTDIYLATERFMLGDRWVQF